jgi:hypothetical protein
MSRKVVFRSILVACAIAVAGNTVAAPLDEGMAAYHAKEYAKAAELWGPIAEQGDAAAQYYLGTLLAEGKGVAQSDSAAFRWFLRAANQGHAGAQYNVGASYAAGTGVGKSYEEAAKWFRRAADQDMVYAQINLGLLYAAGNGVPQDNLEALKWLDLAFRRLPAGEAAMDVAHAIQDVTAKMTREQIDEAKLRERQWKAQPEGK